jgi:hypothetical protein
MMLERIPKGRGKRLTKKEIFIYRVRKGRNYQNQKRTTMIPEGPSMASAWIPSKDVQRLLQDSKKIPIRPNVVR